MDNLPAEIISHIASFLPSTKVLPSTKFTTYIFSDTKAKIAPYVCHNQHFNRSWQIAIEARLWQSLRLSDVEWGELATGMGDEGSRPGRRRKLLLLRCLNCVLSWDPEDLEDDGPFSANIASLYDNLANWANIPDMALQKLHLEVLHPENLEDLYNRGNLAYLYLDRDLFG